MNTDRKNTEARLRANAKYDALNTVQFRLKLNKNTDAELIEWLNSQPNKQGYIKELMLADMAKRK